MDGFSKYHFKDLAQDEKIVKVLHRNWFYLLQQFFIIFFIVGIFVVGLFYAPMFFPEMFGRDFETLAAFMENFFILAVWIYSFLIWVDYYFDIWIITTQRIVNIEQKGMFTRKVSELRYSKIQDVTTEVVGFLPTVINYGDVQIQTAGEEDNFVFRTISDPYHIKNVIVGLQKKHEGEATNQLGEMIKEKIGA
ncbi:MAG: hypothetical protein ACD_9C00271G0004 [uncultured bacterium]|nr:MAG: hypothetical protein ACD_9C00271G0004 [uncultured bacterium]